jgi:serine/threonine protein kinase
MTDFTDNMEEIIEDPPLETGELIVPGYEVIAHLHRSNGFDVYDAWSEERACRCIAKTPKPGLLEAEEIVRGLFREGRLLKKLTHPHIVRAYESIRKPHPTLILETLTGATLAYLIDASSPHLALTDIAHLGQQLCSAVYYLHRHNILHLDLKPSNIISERQMAKIVDLSIARPPGRPKGAVGTRSYTSPEQVRGDYLSPATDVWGIGAVLFEAATNELPFNAHDDNENCYEQLERRAEPVRSYRRVPDTFNALVNGCLEPEPTRRPTVGELIDTLSTLVQKL